MYVSDQPLTASQVMQTFRHDGPYLFLGAAFTSLGLASAAFAFLGRKFNAMLLWLAAFAILYGVRLWLQLDTFALMVRGSASFETLRRSINYLVPIPAFFYFDAAGFLGRFGSRISLLLTVFFLSLFFATIVVGPKHAFDLINIAGVIACLSALVVQSLQQQAADKDFVIIRRGLIAFVAFALCDNVAGSFWRSPHIEPLGFAFFLGALVYATARRTLHRDQQFNEIQKELEIARRIQTAILPSAYPHSTHFQVATRYVPMTSVAGDFYDFVVANDRQAGLLVADVSGHGVPAALIASMVKLAATSQRVNAADPAALLSGMNQTLCGNTQNQFVTAAYVHLDIDSASLRYAAAAHPPMLLLRAGEVIPVEENGLMLAAFTFATYSSALHPLKPGDRLLLYTDGIIEAANAEGVEFGQQRLNSLLAESRLLSPERVADHIISAVQSWSRTQNDDLTLLICDCVEPS
ncbi:MAG TPA: PP2C family protein-serine/threonine phosphatase [Acidobacteriaceae bacterium]|nr:PP2C family protein-serine/threonine phosphatase [Acidobacteriaceae bacterium]